MRGGYRIVKPNEEMSPDLKKKAVSDTRTEQVYIVRSQHINGYGRLFGGMLMQWMDELAGIVARRHAGMTVTTASVDTLNFEAPAYQDDMVVLIGRITHVGTSSMEVRIARRSSVGFSSCMSVPTCELLSNRGLRTR